MPLSDAESTPRPSRRAASLCLVMAQLSGRIRWDSLRQRPQLLTNKLGSLGPTEECQSAFDEAFVVRAAAIERVFVLNAVVLPPAESADFVCTGRLLAQRVEATARTRK